MKFENWTKYVLLDGRNNFLGQGNTYDECIDHALRRGVTPSMLSRSMIHESVGLVSIVRPKTCKVQVHDADNTLLAIRHVK